MIKNIGYLLVIGSLILSFVSYCKSDTKNFLDKKNISESYYNIFKNNKQARFDCFVVPLMFSIGLSILYVPDTNFYSNINVIVSILLSMMLAVLSVLTSNNYAKNYANAEIRKNVRVLVSETCDIILFNSAISMLLLLILIFAQIAYSNCYILMRTAFNCISFYMFVQILFNMLMIMKRLGKILNLPENQNEE